MKKLSAVILGISFLSSISSFAVSQEFSKITPQKYSLPVGTLVAKGGVNISAKDVNFKNDKTKLNLSGTLYTPKNFDKNKKYPAVIVTGPMLSVKEHSQTIYAQRLEN